MKIPIGLAIAAVVGSSAMLGQTRSATPANSQVVFVEVQVTANDGQGIPDLGPAQFEVSIDGSRRRVVTAQSIRVYSPGAAGERAGNVVNGSMQYRLGIEPEPSDQDGNIHQLIVGVDAGARTFTVEAPTRIRLARPANPPAAVSSPAPRSSDAPTESDVAAWARLWGGPEALAAAEKSATAETRPPVAANETVVPAVGATPAATRTAIDDLFATYSAGDTAVLLRELRSPADFERVRPDLVRALARWRTDDWSSRRAAFALEIALTAFVRRWPNPQTFLVAARDIVTARPDAPGARPDDDRFELRFHRAAVAILAAAEGPHGVDAYLTSIQHRVVLNNAPPKGAVLKDARLVMAHATAREIQTLMLLQSVGSRRDDPRAWVVPKNDGRTRRQLEEVGQLLEFAAADEETRSEASVRRAFILYRLSANQEALTLLETAAPTEEVVDYWRALIQGRVLLALGRPQDAIASFERAAMLEPDAQTPAVALMSIFLKIGDREQALGWAERARTTTENRGDQWSQYWAGSTRFLTRWLADLREAQR